MEPVEPLIRKLGTLDLDLVETTPVVWHGRLWRFQYVQARYWVNETRRSYYRFVAMDTGETTPPFAWDHSYGSAHVEGDTMYVFGTVRGGESEIAVFWSQDLVNWSRHLGLSLPGWGIYNQSVCRGPDRYMMALEVGEPAEVVGARFTNFFAESDDLLHWRLLPPEEHVFARDRYTACPVLRYLDDGYYYMIYLEMFPKDPATPHAHLRTEDCYFEPYVVRTRDFAAWESSPLNSVLSISADDKRLANPHFTEAQKAHIAGPVNRNNSDVDLCEYQGQTVILYSCGAQTGTEFLAEAVYEGTMAEFFHGFFPETGG